MATCCQVSLGLCLVSWPQVYPQATLPLIASVLHFTGPTLGCGVLLAILFPSLALPQAALLSGSLSPSLAGFCDKLLQSGGILFSTE